MLEPVQIGGNKTILITGHLKRDLKVGVQY